jgi:hypothetical protein
MDTILGENQLLLRTLLKVSPAANALCPSLDFPVTEETLRRNVLRQVKEHYERHRRITMRNGRYSVHRLPAGVDLGLFLPPRFEGGSHYGIEIARENDRSAIATLLEFARSSVSLHRWLRATGSEHQDWTVLSIFTAAGGKDEDEAARWFLDRFRELKSAGLLDWLRETDRKR